MKRLGLSVWLLALVAFAFGGQMPRQKYRWDNVEIVGGGFVSGILFHPKEANLLYARTDIGGAYRWNSFTHRWMPLMDWIQRPDWNLYGVESIGLDPSDPRRLYLALGTYTSSWAGNGAILRSVDQGRSFKRTDMPFKMGGNMDGRSIGERLAVDPNDGRILFFGSRDSGLWKSGDYGEHWAKVGSFPITGKTDGIGIGFEVFDASSGRRGKATPVIYAGASSGLFRSSDGGATWQAVVGQPTGLTPHHAAFDSSGSLVVTYSNGPGPNGVSGGAVWKLNRKGGWTDITPGAGKGFGYAGLAMDPKHPGTMIVTTLDRWALGDDLFRTVDGGAHWTGMKDSAKMDSSGAPFLNWGKDAPRFGWWIGTVAIDPFHPGTILYGTGATIWGCNDGMGSSTHWTTRAQGLEETADIDLVSPPVGAHLFTALGDIGGFRHDDLTKVPAAGMMLDPLLDNTDSIDFAELKPNVMARVGRGGNGVRRGGYSLDGGESWQPFASEPKGSRGSGSIAVSADGAAMIWTPERLAPFVTRDHGTTWTACTGGLAGLHVVADRVNALKFYGVDGRSGQVFVSEDAGASFRRVSSVLPAGDGVVRALPGREGEFWLAAGHELYRSQDGGLSFVKFEGMGDVSSVGFGKAAPGQNVPCVYVIGAMDGATGAFRSDDAGMHWVCITDARHGYGTMDHIIGDPRIYGRVYIGTNGRGVLFGDPASN